MNEDCLVFEYLPANPRNRGATGTWESVVAKSTLLLADWETVVLVLDCDDLNLLENGMEKG